MTGIRSRVSKSVSTLSTIFCHRLIAITLPSWRASLATEHIMAPSVAEIALRKVDFVLRLPAIPDRQKAAMTPSSHSALPRGRDASHVSVIVCTREVRFHRRKTDQVVVPLVKGLRGSRERALSATSDLNQIGMILIELNSDRPIRRRWSCRCAECRSRGND